MDPGKLYTIIRNVAVGAFIGGAMAWSLGSNAIFIGAIAGGFGGGFFSYFKPP